MRCWQDQAIEGSTIVDEKPSPRWHDQVPFCSGEECRLYDGKRCELNGFRPDGICEPVTREMGVMLAKCEQHHSLPIINGWQARLPGYHGEDDWESHSKAISVASSAGEAAELFVKACHKKDFELVSGDYEEIEVEVRDRDGQITRWSVTAALDWRYSADEQGNRSQEENS